MGNDGGSIPLRRELVKTKKEGRKVREEESIACHLTRAPLCPPIVGDALGRVMNKDAVIEAMLSKSSEDIQSLRDVVELSVEVLDGSLVCPVTGKTMSRNVKFEYLVTCGHVFAHEARDQDDEQCLICTTHYSPEDIIPIDPSPEQIEALQARIGRLNEDNMTHSKTIKKKRKSKVSDGIINSTKRVKEDAPRSKVLASLFTPTSSTPDSFLTRGMTSRS